MAEKAFNLGTKELRQSAILGNKTNTRRIIKTKVPIQDGWRLMTCVDGMNEKHRGMHIFASDEVIHKYGVNRTEYFNSKYQVGDIMWLQEPYQIDEVDLDTHRAYGTYSEDKRFFDVPLGCDHFKLWWKRKYRHRKTAGRFMYRSLARHFFKVTGVGIERVQDISEADAEAEGVIVQNIGETWWRAFKRVWDSCYGVGAWDRNDHVFKYTFEKIER